MIPPETLPMHLLMAMMQSGFSTGASNAWSGSSNDWLNSWMKFMPRLEHPVETQTKALLSEWQNLAEQNAQLLKSLLGKNDNSSAFFDPQFLQSLSEQAAQQTTGFLEGIQSYMGASYERPEKKYRVLWKKGSARLLDLAPQETDGVAILCIPSLINKFYVLDLYPEASFAEYLVSQGYRPLILDWCIPSDAEMDFSCADYISAYAIPALQTLRENHDGPIALLGYCMGGVFAVAMAQLAAFLVDALLLLATPWDFSAEDTPRILLEPSAQMMLRNSIASMNPVPNVIVQTMFHLINPWHVQKKYSAYPLLSAEEKKHFLAVEQWVNDGVPLTQKVAEECLVDWPQGNMLASHQWKIGRKWIEPESIKCPTLCVIPEHDAIVPKRVAEPLAKMIRKSDVMYPKSGHVSMVAGKNAKKELWEPLAKWLAKRF
ncbi:MAG: alpha/beta fold hydrolase [Alphaproteobacteria bacterium]|nr:alpha/beta fold hydrolase [Alphaproteobacteria bacterium]